MTPLISHNASEQNDYVHPTTSMNFFHRTKETELQNKYCRITKEIQKIYSRITKEIQQKKSASLTTDPTIDCLSAQTTTTW